MDVWQKQKMAEKKWAFFLEEPGPATPTLPASFLIGRRVSGIGFDGPSPGGVLGKAREEIGELSGGPIFF